MENTTTATRIPFFPGLKQLGKMWTGPSSASV
jgi:hypothetical protein